MKGIRFVSTSSILFKDKPQNLKGKSKSSQEWLIRQLKDPYVENAKLQNYRCRSAFKLLEVDSKFGLLHPGQCVIDCGAAPGSWVQVCVNKTNASLKDRKSAQGFVVGIDRLPIHPIEGATLLGNSDFTEENSQTRLLDVLQGRKVDVVLSDMAPNATGIKDMDHEAIVTLAYQFIRFTLKISCTGGSLVLKLWEGGMTSKVEEDLKRFYASIKRVKPAASRSDSSEIFIIAKKFKGIQLKV